LIINVEDNWVPSMDFIFFSTTLFDESLWIKYLSSMYHAVMLFGINEMASRTTFVIVSSCFIMLFSAIINANIIGQVAVLIGDISRKSVKFTGQIDSSNTAMSNMGLCGPVKHKVRMYLLNTQATQDQQEELEDFLNNISPSLKFKVLVHIFSGTLRSNFVFSYLIGEYSEEAVIPSIVQNLEIQLTVPETEIVKQGDDPFVNGAEPDIYFIAKGE
jgi:hypothetical protein